MNMFDPADMVQKLKDETRTLDDGDELATARRIFRQNLPLAAMSIVQLSQSATNENTRLRAAQYVTDRMLGAVSSADNVGGDDPFAKFLRQVEAAANSGTV